MATGFRLKPARIIEPLKTNDVREQDPKTPTVSRLEDPYNFCDLIIIRLDLRATKSKQIFNRVQEGEADDLDTMENKLSAYHKVS